MRGSDDVAGGWRREGAFYAACALIAALQLALILRHEPFVDEWQALQIAVQSPDWPALLANLRYEGHPPLWYALLRGLAAIVGPHHALAAASLLLAAGIQGLVLFASPFPRWLRLALALGEPLLFEYAVISRSYSLGVLLVLAAMALWPSRRRVWLPLVLLPAVDFLFGVILLGLLAWRWRERRLWWPGLAACAAVSLLSAWTVLPAKDFVPVYPPADLLSGSLLWIAIMSVVALPIQWGAAGPEWNAVPVFPTTAVLWAGFLWLCLDQTRGRPWERAALFGFLLVTWAFLAFFYALGVRQLMLASVVLVAVAWRQQADGLPLRRPFRLWAGAGAACGLLTAGWALVTPFDTAPRVAALVRDAGPEGGPWLTFPAQHTQGVSAIGGELFEGAGLDCRNDFVRWNFTGRFHNARELQAWVEAARAKEGRFRLVSQVPLAADAQVRPLAFVPAGFDGKQYWLYQIGPADPRVRALRPRCVSGVRPMPPRP